MMITPITLQGVRALLVPMTIDQVSDLFKAGNDPQIWRYISARMQSEDDLRQIVEMALEGQRNGSRLPFTIIDQQTGQIVGSTQYFDIGMRHKHLEIGWTWHNPSVWRTRINTECKFMLLRHAFETLGMIRVQLCTDSRNLRSQKAIERLGGVREGVLRHHLIMSDGHLRDTVCYSILVEEWPNVKARLTDFLDDGQQKKTLL